MVLCGQDGGRDQRQPQQTGLLELYGGMLPPSLHRRIRRRNNKSNGTYEQKVEPSRTCPLCKGGGTPACKFKLLQSQNECKAITLQWCRPRGWVEGGHVPPEVQAALALYKSTRDDEMMGHAISLLSQGNSRDDNYVTQHNNVPVAASSIIV